VHEALIDVLAEKVGVDRLEFRWMNAIRVGQPTATGQVLRASCGLAQCLDRLRPAWREAQTAVAGVNACQHAKYGSRKGLRRGVGVAAMWYGIGNTVIANPSIIRVGLRRTGRVFLNNGVVDIGQGSNTVLPQICADALGLPVALFDQVMGDTDLTPDAGKTSASRQTFVSGNAARFAGEDLRRRLLTLLGAPAGASLLSRGYAGSLARLRQPGQTHRPGSCGSTRRATLPWARGFSIRRPHRWTKTGRGCPTRPTDLPRRWRRSKWTWIWARSRC
jgi:CO/xanthine dehydrogenase Mo-binding subunit